MPGTTNDRKAQWEAKVRASVVVQEVVRGSLDPKLAGPLQTATTAEVDGASAKPAKTQSSASRPAAKGADLDENHSEVKPRRRASAAAHLANRKSWEAQVRASFVTEVYRGPVEASCGQTDVFDDADLASRPEKSDEELNFKAHQEDIATKVTHAEDEIASVLDKLRNDLVS